MMIYSTEDATETRPECSFDNIFSKNPIPIKILSRDHESLSAEYTDASGVTHSLPELLGSFESDLDAELSAIEHASDLMSRDEMRPSRATTGTLSQNKQK